MTKTIDDGGAAFPCGVMQDGHNPGQEPWQRGISMRDYFMAHAPAEPQPWFVPLMPEKPELPDPGRELSAEDAAEWRRLDEFAAEEGNERVKAFCERRSVAWSERHAWETERDKQRYVQWPAAWADAMLRARAA